jgi:hypothetical protein
MVPTREQVKALAKEARELGIPVTEEELRVAQKGTWISREERELAFELARKAQRTRERDFSRSYTTFSIWMEKTTRTSRYQQKVINYIKNHPNATLAEARGHKSKR